MQFLLQKSGEHHNFLQICFMFLFVIFLTKSIITGIFIAINLIIYSIEGEK